MSPEQNPQDYEKEAKAYTNAAWHRFHMGEGPKPFRDFILNPILEIQIVPPDTTQEKN